MARVNASTSAVNARIVYWGVQGAGKTTNLRTAHTRLRPDHRGQVREIASRLDAAIQHEELPITLGEVAGTRTQIEMVTVPGRADHRAVREELLQDVDGVVFVVDATAPLEANADSLGELREALATHGRKLEDTPFVVQYNKRDAADPYALDDLHRGLDMGGVPVFEAVATDGTGVLQTLSTISKRVIRALRDGPTSATSELGDTDPASRMQAALETEGAEPDAFDLDTLASSAQTLFEDENPFAEEAATLPDGVRIGPGLSIVSVGEATRAGERAVRLPLVLGDPEGGTATLVLTIQLDALAEPEPD
ncbi:MAG: ADP-ribosylation factor-like protein [Myxococcota bacterium]|nr:ADP-ribosylation factor-like protein [Myxococcota bacterium]